MNEVRPVPNRLAIVREEVETTADNWGINFGIDEVTRPASETDYDEDICVVQVWTYVTGKRYEFEVEFPPEDDRTDDEVRVETSRMIRALVERVLNDATSTQSELTMPFGGSITFVSRGEE